MSSPTVAESKVALAPGPVTRVTPVGSPETAVVLKPERVVAVPPLNTRLPSGNSSIRCVSAAPSVRVKRVAKAEGVA